MLCYRGTKLGFANSVRTFYGARAGRQNCRPVSLVGKPVATHQNRNQNQNAINPLPRVFWWYAYGMSSKLVGYARVSTTDQSLDLQKDALKEAGCAKLFEDALPGARDDRPGLEAALSYLREGDTLVVWKLDRLGRSLQHLIEIIRDLEKRGVGFKSLREHIDTTTSGGKLFFHLFGALAEFERDLIRERTQAGLAPARARGRKGGRPRAMDPKTAAMAGSLRQNPELSVAEICRRLGISATTLYRYTGKPVPEGPQDAAD